MSDTTFVKIGNREVYNKLLKLEEKIDSILNESKWAKRVAYAAITVACFAVTICIAYGRTH